MRTSRRALCRRWQGEERRVAAIVADLQSNKADWTRNLLASDDGERRPLPFVHTCGRPKLETDAGPRDLRGITLRDVDLSGTEGLADTVLDYATFHNVRLDAASFNGASLRGVIFESGTSLIGIQAHFVSLEGASCKGLALSKAKLQNSNLARCDFRNSDLRSSFFVDSNLFGCDFRGADLRSALFDRVRINEEGLFGFMSFRRAWTKFGGRRQVRRELDQATSARLGDYIEQSTQIREMWHARPLQAFCRYLLSNFGRSATRFGLSTLGGFWLMFALLYTSFPLPTILRGTSLGSVLQRMPHPEFSVNGEVRPLTIADSMYFSATTITTLGYGDITPADSDNLARFLVGAEAIAGVVILGVFVDRLMRDTPKDWE